MNKLCTLHSALSLHYDLVKLKKLFLDLVLSGVDLCRAHVITCRAAKHAQTKKNEESSNIPELSYVSPCAWAFVLRKSEAKRTFIIGATGAEEYSFCSVHGASGAANIEKLGPDVAKVTIDKTLITQSNRVDIAIFGRTSKSDWGAPSFVSFAVLDPNAEYCDPVLLGTNIVKTAQK